MKIFPTKAKTVRSSFILLLMIVLAGCTSAPVPILTATPEFTQTATPIPQPTIETATPVYPTIDPTFPAPTITVSNQAEGAFVALSYQRLDGNRQVQNSGGMLHNWIDVPLRGKPLWVVAAPLEDSSIWAVALENGQVQVFKVTDQEWTEVTDPAFHLPVGTPPVLVVSGVNFHLLSQPAAASPFTHPIPLPGGGLAYIREDGQVQILGRGDNPQLIAVNALPDARLLSDGANRLLFLSQPTDQYPHGVLGDAIEATGFAFVDISSSLPVIHEFPITAGEVIEGIVPIWSDLDGDGLREVVVTQSNALEGARIVAYREDGSILASSSPIGQGFRWVHQLAIGQFIAGEALEIAAVRTPHIGGVVEIYQLVGDKLVVQAALRGYSSHQVGSRNLDSALVIDINNDGREEIVLPDQAQTSLAGIKYTQNELAVVWIGASGGKISTNLAACTLSNGNFALGVGVEEGWLRIWTSTP
jgi:hypothetical protein